MFWIIYYTANSSYWNRQVGWVQPESSKAEVYGATLMREHEMKEVVDILRSIAEQPVEAVQVSLLPEG